MSILGDSFYHAIMRKGTKSVAKMSSKVSLHLLLLMHKLKSNLHSSIKQVISFAYFPFFFIFIFLCFQLFHVSLLVHFFSLLTCFHISLFNYFEICTFQFNLMTDEQHWIATLEHSFASSFLFFIIFPFLPFSHSTCSSQPCQHWTI